MARKRSPKRDKAFQLWYDSGGNRKLKDIAKELGCSPSQIRKWKNQDKWEEKLKGNVTKSKRNVTKKEPAKRPGAPLGNKNAVGNRGGAAPKGNRNAEKHGLFSKYIPIETLELIEHLQQEDEVSRLKRKIAILEAQIIRAQSIMHVESKEELIKHLKKIKKGEKFDEQEWEYQYAWDRQGKFLNSLSRAMSTLTNMYKTLIEMQGNDNEDVKERIGFFVDALGGTIEEVWGDEKEE